MSMLFAVFDCINASVALQCVPEMLLVSFSILP